MNPAIAATMAIAMGGELWKTPQPFALVERVESRPTRFPERQSYRGQVRAARRRRDVQKRGGAR